MTLDAAHPVFRALGSGLHGHVIRPDDPAYDKARAGFYGGYDRRPLAIVRVANASDVAHVIGRARDHGLELAVRGGGHSLAGFGVCDGGIVIDLSEMKGLEIDAAGKTSWAEAGLTAGEYTKAVGAQGLATGFGDTGSVGIGGITLGGGVGYLVRRHGLTIDSLVAAEIVTADGELRRVDAENEPDLFWAIRGGGGNFGVVTRFRFRLHEVPAIVGGILILPATADVIAGCVAAADAAPAELSVIINVITAPPAPFIPAEYHGRVVVIAGIAGVGPAEAGIRAVAPFRGLGKPIVDMVRPMTYPELFQGPEGGPTVRPLAHNMFVDKVDVGTAETILDRLARSTAMFRGVQLRVLGGAVSDVPNEATAYAHRSRRMMLNVAGAFMNPDETATHAAWVADTAKALDQGVPGAYVNFVGDEGQARAREGYPGPTWERLASIKSRYDPANVFHRNQNIPPG